MAKSNMFKLRSKLIDFTPVDDAVLRNTAAMVAYRNRVVLTTNPLVNAELLLRVPGFETAFAAKMQAYPKHDMYMRAFEAARRANDTVAMQFAVESLKAERMPSYKDRNARQAVFAAMIARAPQLIIPAPQPQNLAQRITYNPRTYGVIGGVGALAGTWVTGSYNTIEGTADKISDMGVFELFLAGGIGYALGVGAANWFGGTRHRGVVANIIGTGLIGVGLYFSPAASEIVRDTFHFNMNDPFFKIPRNVVNFVHNHVGGPAGFDSGDIIRLPDSGRAPVRAVFNGYLFASPELREGDKKLHLSFAPGSLYCATGISAEYGKRNVVRLVRAYDNAKRALYTENVQGAFEVIKPGEKGYDTCNTIYVPEPPAKAVVPAAPEKPAPPATSTSGQKPALPNVAPAPGSVKKLLTPIKAKKEKETPKPPQKLNSQVIVAAKALN